MRRRKPGTYVPGLKILFWGCGPGVRRVVLRAANQDSHDCRWQSYRNLRTEPNHNFRQRRKCKRIPGGSPSRMRRVRRISLGITIRPKSSSLLTMTVAFVYLSPLQISRRGTSYGGVPTLILQITLLVSVKRGDLYTKNPMIDFPQMQRYN